MGGFARNVLGERLRTLRFDPLRSVKFVLKTRKRLIWMVVKTLDKTMDRPQLACAVLRRRFPVGEWPLSGGRLRYNKLCLTQVLVGFPIPMVKNTFGYLDHHQINHHHGCQNGIKLDRRRNEAKIRPQRGKWDCSADHYNRE